MGQVACRQRHVVLDGAIDVIAAGEDARPVHHRLHISPKLRDPLRRLAERQCEVGEVVNVRLEQLTGEGKNCIVAAQVLLNLVRLETDDGLKHMRLGLKDELLLL